MSTDRRVGAAALLAAAGLIGLTLVLPSPSAIESPSPYGPTAASLIWLRAMHGFGMTQGNAQPEQAQLLHAELQVLHALDPRFIEPARTGTAMLRVLEGGDGPHTRAWAARWPGRAKLLQPESP